MVMIALNLLRLFQTWGDYGTDGFEQIGFPFVFFERGGSAYQENRYYHWLGADIVIAIVGAAWAAHLLRDGWFIAFRRFQKWGLEDVESTSRHEPVNAAEDADDRQPE